ncbi:MAG: flagellar protein export ATPase FliI [Gammaproteobacteria bacterium]|nr:flagellar protein export ATPase FliI [Gammaproteobacteria bacterium]
MGACLRKPRPLVSGRLTRMVGLTIEASGCYAPLGTRCRIEGSDGKAVDAEVVGFNRNTLYLMPIGHAHGFQLHARVTPMPDHGVLNVGPQLLGRVLDGSGAPIDGLGPLSDAHMVELRGRPINPLSRHPIDRPLDVGVRAINGLLPVGRGQRIGLFAGSGVGKSMLLGMMTRFTEAEVIVVGLIGERGREVKEFIEKNLGKQGMSRSVVIASPADAAPLMRLHGALAATRIAEYFRDQGKHVLLLMDSLTRYAQAQREIGLAVGEPPATKGYPPSVFSRIPELIERTGNSESESGSITAFYTILVEGDDTNDPVADSARAILDGHIMLSRTLADGGLYPAIDIESSVSRVIHDVTTEIHRESISRFRKYYSLYNRSSDLINIGAYKEGADAELDRAVALYPRLRSYISQKPGQASAVGQSVTQLAKLFDGTQVGANNPEEAINGAAS